MSECDRALLAKACTLMYDVYDFAERLLSELEEGYSPEREVAESGLRVVDAERLAAHMRAREREFMRRLLRCSVRLRPIRA